MIKVDTDRMHGKDLNGLSAIEMQYLVRQLESMARVGGKLPGWMESVLSGPSIVGKVVSPQIISADGRYWEMATVDARFIPSPPFGG